MTGGRLRKGRGEEKKAPQKVLRLRARDVLQDIKKIVVPRRETVSRRRGETQDTTDTRTFSSVSILALYIPIRQRRHENHSPTAMYKNPVPPLPRAPKTTAEVCSDVKAIQNYFLCTETPPPLYANAKELHRALARPSQVWIGPRCFYTSSAPQEEPSTLIFSPSGNCSGKPRP